MSVPPIKGRGRGRGSRISMTPDQPQASTSNLSDASPSTGGGGISRRPVGGLLGGSEYVKRASSLTGGTKFKPNMVRKARVPDPDDDDDDDDIPLVFL